MIIAGAALNLSARHLASDTTTSRGSMQAWVDVPGGGGTSGGPAGSISVSQQRASLSRAATVEVSSASQVLNAAIIYGAGVGGASAITSGSRSALNRLPGSPGDDARADSEAARLFAQLDAPAQAALKMALADIAAVRAGKSLSGAFAQRPGGADAAGQAGRWASLALGGLSGIGSDDGLDDAVRGDAKLMSLIALIERLTGRKVHLLRAKDMQGGGSARTAEAMAAVARSADGARGTGRGRGGEGATEQAPQQAGFGIAVDVHTEHHEAEVTSVNVSGIVVTADGRRLDVSMDVTMSRSLAETTDFRLRAGDAKLVDPLVIDLGSAGASAAPDPNAIVGLAQATFAFDLDSDGVNEQIHTLAPSSGFLVLDKNGNGRVDNGSELLGPGSGNGFADVAALDGDGNGWIDERDATFGQLRVWSPGSGGGDGAGGATGGSLLSLAAAGVGAISTANVSSPFLAKDGTGDVRGQVVATGLYLSESGLAGAIHQVDLAV